MGYVFLEEPKEKVRRINIEKKRAFIINCIYWAIILLISVLLLKYAIPILAPFVIGFIIVYLLKRPINFLARRTKIKENICGIIVVLVFYCTIGILLSLVGIKLFSVMENLVYNLTQIYGRQIEPVLMMVFDSIEDMIIPIDQMLGNEIENIESDFVKSLGNLVTEISVDAVAKISDIATSLPGLFIKIVLMIISTFFIAADFDKITGFCVRQMGEKTRKIGKEIEEYVVGTLLVCIRSYAIIMSLTFVELSIGLSILRIENAVLIALVIAVFDILPVLGTGGIMIPWTVITFIQGDMALGVGLLIVYLVITVIRNIVEPKIVGKQLGLHPVVTLASMFAGVQLLGGIGLFGFPIGLSLLKNLNDKGIIHILK